MQEFLVIRHWIMLDECMLTPVDNWNMLTQSSPDLLVLVGLTTPRYLRTKGRGLWTGWCPSTLQVNIGVGLHDFPHEGGMSIQLYQLFWCKQGGAGLMIGGWDLPSSPFRQLFRMWNHERMRLQDLLGVFICGQRWWSNSLYETSL